MWALTRKNLCGLDGIIGCGGLAGVALTGGWTVRMRRSTNRATVSCLASMLSSLNRDWSILRLRRSFCCWFHTGLFLQLCILLLSSIRWREEFRHWLSLSSLLLLLLGVIVVEGLLGIRLPQISVLTSRLGIQCCWCLWKMSSHLTCRIWHTMTHTSKSSFAYVMITWAIAVCIVALLAHYWARRLHDSSHCCFCSCFDLKFVQRHRILTRVKFGIRRFLGIYQVLFARCLARATIVATEYRYTRTRSNVGALWLCFIGLLRSSFCQILRLL